MYRLLSGIQPVFLEVHRSWRFRSGGSGSNGRRVPPLWSTVLVEGQFAGQEEQMILGRGLALFPCSLSLAIEAVQKPAEPPAICVCLLGLDIRL